MNENLRQTGTRLMRLRETLKAREGVPGYEKNCEDIKAEIARLEGSTISPKPGAV